VLIPASTSLRWAAALVTASCIGLLALTAPPAAAATGRAMATAGVRPKPIDHFNVGAAHSPQLLKELAASGGTTSAQKAASTASSVLSGAAQGVDVASFQHPSGAAINWAQVASAGKKFAAVKSTEGDYYENRYALNDLAQARAAGLSVAAYAFAIPNGGGSSASPVTQADDIINYLKSGSAGIPPIMLDIEYDPYVSQDGTNQCYGLSQSAMVTWISNFVTEVKNKTGLYPIIYSTTGWWTSCTGNSASFASDPLWIASFNTLNPPSPGPLPAGWANWTYWQYASNGTVSGISGSVDLDQLNPGMLTLLNPGDQQGAEGAAVNTGVLAQGSGLTYSASGLPSGLSIDSSTGVITGSLPSAPGAYPVTVQVTDSTPTTVSASFTWYVHGTLTVNPPGNQSTTEGGPVDIQVPSVSDTPAEPPVTFSAPVLPPGLSITTAGLITGWPEAPGTYQVTVHAADSLEAAGSASFTWTVGTAPGTGPAGPVRLSAGGKCLNDVGNSSANGTQADIWTCNGSTSQKYTYAGDESLRIHGKCVTAQGSAALRVLLEPCTGAAAGQWMLVYPRSVNPKAGTVPLGLVNPASGWCLGVPGSTSNGTRVLAGSCNGTTYQAWTLPAGPVGSQLPGKCLDDRANSTVNGTTIDLWSCNGTAAQQWTPEPDGTIRVHGKCLDVHSGATASGTPVDLWSCNGTAAQQWHLLPAGAGSGIVNPHSGRCLTDPGDATVSGTALQIVSCAGAPGQRWRVQ
jgi:GH25 family lysozyme M1 (1,4-beta-N-acetylmuramidase)